MKTSLKHVHIYPFIQPLKYYNSTNSGQFIKYTSVNGGKRTSLSTVPLIIVASSLETNLYLLSDNDTTRYVVKVNFISRTANINLYVYINIRHGRTGWSGYKKKDSLIDL